VDVQEKLMVKIPSAETLIRNSAFLLDAARLLEVEVAATEQYPKGLGPTVPELREALAPAAPVVKMTFDCCGEPAFTPALEAADRSTVVVCGMETHVCVLQTVLGLLARGLVVHVAADGVCSRSAENHRIALELMRDAGAVVTCAETVLFQLLGRCGTPEFKTIQARIK